MKILSIDTASNICGVCISEDDKPICCLDTLTDRKHSEILMPLISDAFSQSGLTIQDIDLIVCDIGPGSFTGIRIGVATVKAFADCLNIPCVGISSLEALCYRVKTLNFTDTKFICSLIDCKHDSCYFAVYRLENDKISCVIKPSTDTISNILKTLKDFTDIVFIGDGAVIYKDFLTSTFSNAYFVPDDMNCLDSSCLTIAGLNYYSQFGENSILPLYLKKPQAEKTEHI